MSEDQYAFDINKLTYEQINKIRAYLKTMIDNGGSDLHVKANSAIRMRNKDGDIVAFSGGIFEKADALILAKELLRTRFHEFVKNKEIDLVYPFDETSRFRVNMFFQMDGVSAVFRVIPMKTPTFEDYNLPEVLRSFTTKKSGIVLVTGATGSGKSTTLASIINEINKTQRKHIITIEDPIEFVHKDNKCIINQRSVGQDTLSFSAALKSALREDPDIILVGEMRDKESISLALHAADTGHLVFSTLHTIDAKETINRIISQFPPDEQNRVRASFSGVLQGIVSQRLVKTIEGGRRAAMEVLVHNATIEKLILENRDHEIRDAIEQGKSHYKSQSFDQALLDLYNDGIISREQAKENATSPADLELKMNGFNSGIGKDTDTLAKSVMQENDEDIFDLK
ncbi:MAG: PilT/PilU family type 4a pilus ATPase [Sulfurimonas sp.]|jgi:twitching motility protein PilT